MSLIKSAEDIERLRESGRRLSAVLKEVMANVRVGVSTKSLDTLAYQLIIAKGDKPAFLNYTPHGADRPFPSTLCVSVNDEVVHGIPSENDKVLKDGDIISLDIGLIHEGLVTDMAVTLPVGNVDSGTKHLLDVTKRALDESIKVCVVGAKTGDIGVAVERVVENTPFSIVSELGGHGVGYSVHDEPFISNLGAPNKGTKLVSGMALALEPILNAGTENVFVAKDGYTFKTEDGRKSAHFEHTILITESGPEIITKFL
jgi:methionyl aminopeptidase